MFDVSVAPSRIFYWIDHTSAYDGNSGVQRVVRALAKALTKRHDEIVYVGWSEKHFSLVRSDTSALQNLARYDGPNAQAQAEPSIPIHLNGVDAASLKGSWLIVPEVTHHRQHQTRDLIDYCRAHDIKVAFIFYDLIPITRPGYDHIRALHEAYAQQLSRADLVIPISEHSGKSLRSYYLETQRLSLAEIPEIAPVLLGETFTEADRPAIHEPAAHGRIEIAALGTIEPRKNQIGLVRAFNRLCQRRPDLDMRLTIVGHLQGNIADEFNALIAKSPKVKHLGYQPDAEISDIYARSHFTVFASVEEGYGLPIVESVWFGRPSICGNFGSMAEVAAGGGCLTIDTTSEQAIERAIEKLASDQTVRRELTQAALNRRFRAWGEYAADVMNCLHNHMPLRRVYLWCDLIVSQPFNTGVQRVVRSMAKAIEDWGVELVCVRWDRERDTLRCLTDDELAHMARWNGPSQKVQVDLPADFAGEWIILPEVMVPLVPEDGSLLPRLRERGLKICSIFYDLIPHKMKENYPQVAVDYFTRYWLSIAESDLILGISKTVSRELYEFYQPRLPKLNNLQGRIHPALLAGEFPEKPRSYAGPNLKPGTLNLLNVGTIEPRKNQFLLIEAIAEARLRTGVDIQVTFVGRGGAFTELDARMSETVEAHSWITRLEHVTDDVLEQLYFNADLTAFASFEEGFGLPVLESLWACRPCICHNSGAIAEVAEGGGCLMVDMLDKEAITAGLVKLATSLDLIARLTEEAKERPIRTWKDYALDVLTQMSHTGPRPEVTVRKQAGFRHTPLEALDRPLLSIAITTYNRAEWLKHSLAGILEATRPYRDAIEVLVCDNASTDNTAEAVEAMRREEAFGYFRNPKNVGMLGNLGVTASHASGEYVWVIGDDDLLVPGVIENILDGILDHPEAEMVYLNYAYTNFDKPADLEDTGSVVAAAKPIAEGGPNRFVPQLREVAALNENFFTAIYAVVFRREHAMMAYGQNIDGPPFTSLRTCVPSTLYAMKCMLDLPAYWVGEPGVVVNMNVSWRKWALLWHLERMPELYDWAERERMSTDLIDRYRWNHCSAAAEHVKGLYFHTEDGMRDTFDVEKFIAQNIHLQPFRTGVLAGVLKSYAEAYAHGRTAPGATDPLIVAERFGVSDLLK